MIKKLEIMVKDEQDLNTQLSNIPIADNDIISIETIEIGKVIDLCSSTVDKLRIWYKTVL